MPVRLGFVGAWASLLLLIGFAKRIPSKRVDKEIDELGITKEYNGLASPLDGIPIPDLPRLVQQVSSQARLDVRLGHFLGKGGFGVAFEATLGGKRSVVKLAAMNNKNATSLDEVQVATISHVDFRQTLYDMRDECALMEDLKLSDVGKVAAQQDPAGAAALSDCYLNCHGEGEDCKTEETQPPFIVVSYGGENGRHWLESKPEKGDINSVLNQVREGIRFMSEVRGAPVIHHDLKWDNVCVQLASEVDPEAPQSEFSSDWKANIIDFGAAVEFVFHKNRSKQKTVGSLGYAPPEWFSRKAAAGYDDPPWSFDVYSLGAMAVAALCDVEMETIRKHSAEMAALLNCRDTDAKKLRLCVEGSDCPEKTRCNLRKDTLDAASTEMDFSKAPGDYNRFQLFQGGKWGIHKNFCDRAVTEEGLRRVCYSVAFLMHPNPRWRIRPSAFKFDDAGVVAEKWQPESLEQGSPFLEQDIVDNDI